VPHLGPEVCEVLTHLASPRCPRLVCGVRVGQSHTTRMALSYLYETASAAGGKFLNKYIYLYMYMYTFYDWTTAFLLLCPPSPCSLFQPTLVFVKNILSYVGLYQVGHCCSKIQCACSLTVEQKKAALYQASLVEPTGPKNEMY
jgi:hypothetical protein